MKIQHSWAQNLGFGNIDLLTVPRVPPMKFLNPHVAKPGIFERSWAQNLGFGTIDLLTVLGLVKFSQNL